MSAGQNVILRLGRRVGQNVWFCLKSFFKRLIACKPMKEVQADIERQHRLRRTLNWYQLTAVGLGAIIGAGIAVLSGQAAANFAGPSVIISFVVTGIVALLAALSFSELAALMPHSGAAYTYTYTALGEYLAWFIGWNYALLYQLGALTVVVNWSKYVVHFINHISDYNVTKSVVEAPWVWNGTTESFSSTGQVINIPAIAITIGITLLLISGIRPTAMVNLVLVIIKIIIFLIFIFACCKYVDPKNYKPFFPPNEGSFSKYGATGMLEACTQVFFAYIGFDTIAAVAQEAKPKNARSIAFAKIASVIISAMIFIGICTVMVGLVPYKLLDSKNPLSTAIDATPCGLWLKILVDLGIIASLTTVSLITLLAQIRIFYAMANDGLLPPFFARIRSETPWMSTIISGVFCAVVAGIFPVDIVGETTSIAALITYLFVHIEVIVMRFTEQTIPRPFRVPFGRWLIPIVGSLFCILLMKSTSKATAYRFLAWTAIGQIFYFSYGFWHPKLRPPPRDASVISAAELLPTVETISMEYMYTESEPELVGSEITENKTDETISYYL